MAFGIELALPKEKEQRQSRRDAERDIANNIEPEISHPAPPSLGKDKEPQRHRRDDDIQTEESGDVRLEKLPEEQRHVKAMRRQKRNELRKRKHRAENRRDKVKPLNKISPDWNDWQYVEGFYPPGKSMRIAIRELGMCFKTQAT